MRKSSYVKIGAFICAAIILAAVAVIMMGSGSMRKRELLLETFLEETVQGVSEGSAVKYRGIPVGTVKSVTFAMADYRPEDALPGTSTADLRRAIRYARVVFAIDTSDLPDQEAFAEHLEKQISDGLRAHMKSQGITGLVYVDLDYEDPGKPTLPVPWKTEYRYIPTAPSLAKTLTDVVQNVAQEIHGFSDLKVDATNLMTRLSSLIDNADGTVAGLRIPLENTLDDLSRVSKNLAEILDAIRDDPGRLFQKPANENMP